MAAVIAAMPLSLKQSSQSQQLVDARLRPPAARRAAGSSGAKLGWKIIPSDVIASSLVPRPAQHTRAARVASGTCVVHRGRGSSTASSSRSSSPSARASTPCRRPTSSAGTLAWAVFAVVLVLAGPHRPASRRSARRTRIGPSAAGGSGADRLNRRAAARRPEAGRASTRPPTRAPPCRRRSAGRRPGAVEHVAVDRDRADGCAGGGLPARPVPRDVRLGPAALELGGRGAEARDQCGEDGSVGVAARGLAEVGGEIARELLGVLRRRSR